MRSRFALLVCLFFFAGAPSTIGLNQSPSPTLQVAERVERSFKVSLYRRVGVVQEYVIVCSADEVNSHTKLAIGRAFKDAPEDRANDRGFLRCLMDEKPALSDICQKEGEGFDDAANAALEKCAEAEPLSEDGAADPRTFSQDDCRARFISYVGANVRSLWTCECYQKDYSVIPGAAIFSTEMSPGDAELENEILKQCTANTKVQLEDACKYVPNDFQLLGLHILQTCCKRARKAYDAKLQCAEAVPADISHLKFMSFFADV